MDGPFRIEALGAHLARHIVPGKGQEGVGGGDVQVRPQAGRQLGLRQVGRQQGEGLLQERLVVAGRRQAVAASFVDGLQELLQAGGGVGTGPGGPEGARGVEARQRVAGGQLRHRRLGRDARLFGQSGRQRQGHGDAFAAGDAGDPLADRFLYRGGQGHRRHDSRRVALDGGRRGSVCRDDHEGKQRKRTRQGVGAAS